MTDRRACLGSGGRSRATSLQPLADADLSDAAFPYLHARRISVGGVDVEAVRISYAGELGWELAVRERPTAARSGTPLWPAGAAPAWSPRDVARSGTLRLEKGYRAWGTDLTREHGPDESGLGLTVRRRTVDFLGRDGARANARRRAAGSAASSSTARRSAMGGEPVLVGRRVVGYVTSAGLGRVDRAEHRLRVGSPRAGHRRGRDVRYFDRTLPGALADEPLFDPGGERLRA